MSFGGLPRGRVDELTIYKCSVDKKGPIVELRHLVTHAASNLKGNGRKNILYAGDGQALANAKTNLKRAPCTCRSLMRS